MNKFKIELLTVARYKLNYGKTYLSKSSTNLLLGMHFKYTIPNLQILHTSYRLKLVRERSV